MSTENTAKSYPKGRAAKIQARRQCSNIALNDEPKQVDAKREKRFSFANFKLTAASSSAFVRLF